MLASQAACFARLAPSAPTSLRQALLVLFIFNFLFLFFFFLFSRFARKSGGGKGCKIFYLFLFFSFFGGVKGVKINLNFYKFIFILFFPFWEKFPFGEFSLFRPDVVVFYELIS